MTDHGGADLLALAGLKLSNGDLDAAIEMYSHCLTFAPQDAGARNNLAVALLKSRRFAEAEATLEAALALRPGYTRALVNLGKVLRELGRPAEAIVRLREALSLQPDYVPALINLGDACAAIGDVNGALKALERAARLAPAHVEARMSLGIARLQADQVAGALEELQAAVVIAPHHPDAHSNLAHALFCSGDWRASWPHFEHRFSRLHQAKLRAPAGVPRWDGEISNVVEPWLLGEQGLGDQLMFARYARLLRARGLNCTLACDARLVKILALAGLGARIVPLDAVPEGPNARWIPLMSMAAWHGTQPDTVPAAEGYLAADPQRIAYWRAQLPAARLRVALSWAGNPRMETGRYAGRSPPLSVLAPLMNIPGVSFISLQKGSGEEQLDAVPFGASIRRLTALDDGQDAFLDTAAVLKCVDLLVTSDTAIAHLAGGLGVPCWLCLMHEPDWRWMRRGAATPWYSSMRLFRQRTNGDWSGVFAEVASALALAVADR